MSIENFGPMPVAEGVIRQVDTITISSVTPAALTKVAVVSYPAFEVQGASPTADVIVVTDTTSNHVLVLNTDYILTATGAGPTLTYTVTRISTSANSSNGDTCTVAYNYGTIPDTMANVPPTGTAPTGTASNTSVQDTTGTAVAGVGAALPGGSLTDPAAGAQSSSETGAPGSEGSALQGAAGPQAPSQYGWPRGVPDTESAYGGGQPASFSPVLGNAAYTSGNIGTTADPSVIDTTIGGGAVRVDGTPNVYRSPIAGVAAAHKDTTLTDILGNQINANPTTGTVGNVTGSVDTQYYGAPATPTALKQQTDVFAATSTATKYYMSQQGLVPSTIVVTDTTAATVLTITTDYTVTTAGNGPTATSYIQPVAGTHYTTGDSLSVAYSYGDPTYWDSNTPSAPPAAPGMAVTTSQTDTLTISAAPANFTLTGIVTPPGSVTVVDQTGLNAGKTLVMNADYKITVSSSGSTLAMSITRLGGSVNSSNGDSVQVTYSTGNAAFFTSGPVRAVNRGVLVPFTPSTAVTPQQDYFWVQSSTLGTQWVPAAGQAIFSGQPSGAGAMVGEPTYQADTFTGAFSSSAPNTLSQAGIITAPGQLVVRDTTSSAYTIPTSGYITGGMADPLFSPPGSVLIYGVDYTVTVTGAGPFATMQVQRVATSVNSANGDTIIVEYFYDTLGTSNLTAVADSVTMVAGAVTLSHTGIITAPQSLIVYDSTKSTALAYNLDYTVTQIGTGPTTNYTITRISTGPAGVGATDALTVNYLYGVVLGTVFTQGMYENYPVIYKPNGTLYGFQGYRFSVAAGNRAGLSGYSNWSDYVVPLNYNAPQPGFQGTTQTLQGLDPVNSINPVYRPDGTIKAGTGLGG